MELRRVWGDRPESERSFNVFVDSIRENLYKLSLSSYRKGNEKSSWVPLGGPNGVCKIILGGTPSTKTPAYFEGEHLWATITDMKDRYVNHTERRITQEAINNSSVKLLPRGTVLVSFKLTIGKMAIAGKDIYTNEAIAGLIPKDDRVLSEYLYHLIPALDLRAYMQPATKGKTLNKKILERIKIPVPSISEQEKFIVEMNDMEAKKIDLMGHIVGLDQKTQDAGKTFLVKQH